MKGWRDVWVETQEKQGLKAESFSLDKHHLCKLVAMRELEYRSLFLTL